MHSRELSSRFKEITTSLVIFIEIIPSILVGFKSRWYLIDDQNLLQWSMCASFSLFHIVLTTNKKSLLSFLVKKSALVQKDGKSFSSFSVKNLINGQVACRWSKKHLTGQPKSKHKTATSNLFP